MSETCNGSCPLHGTGHPRRHSPLTLILRWPLPASLFNRPAPDQPPTPAEGKP